MTTAKTTTLAFRIEPALKEALRTAAKREHRSIAKMVEVLIRDYCSRSGIAIPNRNNVQTTQESVKRSKKNTV